ncbi:MULTISPECIES: peptide deformylase [Terrabacteria group]|uniref:peptide deformylase n=1 Tax=Bacillati TaxID=1783272 RepID=UPI001C6ED40B|nr:MULTISPECIES: peptide deformylase [Terrabacteria group]MBW9211984.1 peptide deformylase [Trueperella sp. zg.1013]
MLINNDTIVKDNDPIIRTKSKKVKLPLSEKDASLLRDMLQYVKDSTDKEKAKKYNLRPAVGISAIQVGVPKRMMAVVVDDVDKNGELVHYEYMLVNAKIVSESAQPAYLSSGEGCLSVVNDHPGYVVRKARVTVEAYDLASDKMISIRARGYLAIVLQHELDHFDGRLFYDRIDKKNPMKKVDGALVI